MTRRQSWARVAVLFLEELTTRMIRHPCVHCVWLAGYLSLSTYGWGQEGFSSGVSTAGWMFPSFLPFSIKKDSFFSFVSFSLSSQLRQEASGGELSVKLEEIRKALTELALKHRDFQKWLAESKYRLGALDAEEQVRTRG